MIKKGFIFSTSIFFLLASSIHILPIKNVRASENSPENTASNLEILQKKVGRNFRYSLDKNKEKVNFISDGKSGLPLNLKGIDKNDADEISKRFLKEYSPYFGATKPDKELSLLKKDADSLGMAHFRYGQKYDGVPVFGGQINIHLKKDKTVSSANGKFIPDISLDTTPDISADQATDIAKKLWKEQKRPEKPEVLKNRLYIFNKSLFQNKPDETKNYLVWKVDLFKDKPKINREYYFIDAKTGELVFQITGIQDAVDRRVYDCSRGDNCYLDQLISGYTYGRSEGQPARLANPLWGRTDTDDLYDILGSAHTYYLSNFSRNGANNLGGLGDGYFSPYTKTDGVTYYDYYNPMECLLPNAFFFINTVYFCEGMVTSDIAGHEYAHAVNSYSIPDGYGDPSGLTYSGESGALNESNSDIFGEALENAITEGGNDWVMAGDLDIAYRRDMSMPSNYTYNVGAGAVPYPNKFTDSNFYCGDEDFGGVHINSSVPNHAAYLMAMGGTYNGYTISGIGRAKEEAIFYRAQDVYYTTSTDFNGAYDDLITACGDLYGGVGSADCQEVAKALQAVEINQSNPCEESVPTTPIYRLYNTLNGAYLYTRGDADKAHVLNTWSEFEFTDGIPAFYASLTEQDGLTPMYRLYNTLNGAYLYTRGDADKAHVMNTWPEFEFTDGIPAFYASLIASD